MTCSLPDRATLARLAAAPLPRYTSYPPAPHFVPLTEAAFTAWLAEAGPADSLSLYVHIPFCQSLCLYCGCHTTATRSAERLARYGTLLVREAELLAARLPDHGGVAALHLGGGTPTSLGENGLRQVVTALRRLFPFRSGAEIATELDPRFVTPGLIATLVELGVNRVSLGVQDIAAAVQRRIGRLQPPGVVAAAVSALRAAGIDQINMDLMYGLPGQGVAEVEASARFAAACGADRIAVFGYAHVPWLKPHQRAIATAELPDAAARLAQAEAAQRVLTAAGYLAIGLDHFARPRDTLARAATEGRLRRNFQGYTTDTAPFLLGLGASAISRTPRGYAQNATKEWEWAQAIAAGHLAIVRGRVLSPADHQRGAIIEQVMCTGAIALTALPDDLRQEAAPRLAALERVGLLRREQDRLVMAEVHRPFLRHFAACFDAYLAPASVPRHTAAV